MRKSVAPRVIAQSHPKRMLKEFLNCHLRKSVNNVTYELNFPTSKILVSFYSLIWRIYYKLSYEFCKKQVEKM